METVVATSASSPTEVPGRPVGGPVDTGSAAASAPVTGDDPALELTILMPCLDEAETLAVCIRKAIRYLERAGVAGEVLIADNGSTDGSQQIAVAEGARVVDIPARGYGSALIGGITAARGQYVIMGDSDDSYDFSSLDAFVEGLRAGNDLVMGNRFRGGIAKGAMPPLHRYLGNPVLSFIGRLFFTSAVKDFHCGLRGFRRDSALSLGLTSPGMEFASEMVVKATLAGQRIIEVPTTLSPDGRSRPPHLRSWRDGWRHLRFLLLYSPRWLFFYPGLLLGLFGGVLGTVLLFGPLNLGVAVLDIHTLAVCSGMVLVGYQAVWFAVLTKVFASREGLLPGDQRVERFRKTFPLETALKLSGLLILVALIGLVVAVANWGFDPITQRPTLRLVMACTTLGAVGVQTVFCSFLLSILSIPSNHAATPPE